MSSASNKQNAPMLCFEPDVAVGIFIMLPVADICQVELVCLSWRTLIIEYSVWRQKLINRYHCNPFWKDLLQQRHWNSKETDHEINKRICLEVAAILPDDQSEDVSKIVLKGFPLNETILSKTKILPNFQHVFLQRLVNDKKKIISKIPQRPLGKVGIRRGPRKIKFPRVYLQKFSKLLLFGPAAFPILVEKSFRNDVILAGARYGKGRIVVASHHEMLNNEALMQVRKW